MAGSAVDLSLGRYGVFRENTRFSSDYFTVCRLEKVTDKQIVSRGYRPQTTPISACIATFANEQDAGRFVQSMDGIAGEMIRRQREAREACERAWAAAIAKATGALSDS